MSYWFGILIPVLSLIVAVLAIKKDNQDIESRVLIKSKEQTKEILKKEIGTDIEMLTKKMDSVLTKTQTND